MRYIWLSLAAWSIFVLGITIWEIIDQRVDSREIAVSETRRAFNKDQYIRQWVSSHGGVYVPATEQTPPNPYLSHIPERDIKTPSGKHLTLMNPAYMVRQLNEVSGDDYGVGGHITSLNPLRPENAADEWETKALKSFGQGAMEALDFSEINGKPYIRLMQAMIVKKPCLKCHAVQGYKEGDVRGGVSFSMSMNDILAVQKKHGTSVLMYSALMWGFGTLGLLLGGRALKRREGERLSFLDNLEYLHSKLEEKVKERTHTLEEEVKVRKSAEEKLLHQRLFQDAILENISDGIVACDEKGALSLFNRATMEFHGLSEEDLPPEEWASHYDLYRPDGRTLISKEEVPLFRAFNGEELKDVEMVIAPKNRQKLTLLASGKAMLDGKGRKLGAVVSMHDITERKMAEEKLRVANERLLELDRLKSMFIASMSHELRTPLNSIIGFSGILLQGISGEINEQQRDQVERISSSGKHLLSLINDVIDISKAEAGMIEILPETFPLNELIEEATASVKRQIEDKGLLFEVISPLKIELHMDRRRLLQCVLNYLSNAIKFTRAGKIRLKVMEAGGDIEISVSDTGIGIPAEEMPKLFLPFERLEHRILEAIPGSGLGLYITKKMVLDVLHGEVGVESEEGKGSTFRLRVPKGRPPQEG